VASPGNENADGDDDENVWKVSVARGDKYHPRGPTLYIHSVPPLSPALCSFD
jgi:hypothetical protein